MLPAAAKWLCHTHASDGEVDLGHTIVAVAGRRGGRRLLELIVDTVGKQRLIPPTIVTPGGLAEHLYEPEHCVTDDLSSRLVRLSQLRTAPADLIERIAGRRPDDDDLGRWLDLADQCQTLHEALSAEVLRPDDVAVSAAHLLPPEALQRWEAITALQQAYESALHDTRRQDQHMARFAALDDGDRRIDRQIVLVGTVDLNGITRRLLEVRAGEVAILVHAPEAMAETFDALGCLRSDAWYTRPIDITSATLHVVDGWTDQPTAALDCLARATQDHALSIEDVTLGLGDTELEPLLHRRFAHADTPVHLPSGTALAATAPCRLLHAIAAWTETQSLADLASLLRHPHAGPWCQRLATESADGEMIWPLTLLDTYLSQHLQDRPGPPWQGQHGGHLQTLLTAVEQLVPETLRARHGLATWGTLIMEVLDKLYADRPLRRSHIGDHDTMQALESIASALQAFETTTPNTHGDITLSMREAVQLLQHGLPGNAAPMEPDTPAVELLGWLELHADDAPWLLIAGFNEGQIPASRGIDPWLPNRLRTTLQMPDDQRRLARDAYLLTAKLHSCDSVTLIASRHGHGHDPLPPSRLLLTGHARDAARRLKTFFESTVLLPDNPPAPGTGHQRRFRVPLPTATPDRIQAFLEQAAVTALRAYVACPYRFYLQYIEKLSPSDVDPHELDPLAFGLLLHDVLRAFGASSGLTDCEARQPIESWLHQRLQQDAAQQFGDTAHAAVALQLAFACDRLSDFATWQAETAAAGWRIIETEHPLALPMGEVATLVGRVDRIDRHPNGNLRLIDYKTGDTPADPKRNRVGRGENQRWIDFQLPCYRRMVESAGLVGSTTSVEVGYVVLPQQRHAVTFVPGPWDEDDFNKAMHQAATALAKIRDGIFWPPASAPSPWDAYGRLCGEGVFDRPGLLDHPSGTVEKAGER